MIKPKTPASSLSTVDALTTAQIGKAVAHGRAQFGKSLERPGTFTQSIIDKAIAKAKAAKPNPLMEVTLNGVRYYVIVMPRRSVLRQKNTARPGRRKRAR